MSIRRESLQLYGITERSCLRGGRCLTEAVEEALSAGVTMLQYREKRLGREEFLREAEVVRGLCRRYGVPFIVNDDPGLAVLLRADGVHVGQGDMAAAKAREVIGQDRILGVTARSVAEALAAEASGADYLGSGAVFATGTKKDARPMSRETLQAIASAVHIPVAAIGGIDSGNAITLRGTGIAGLAVAGGIFGQEDIRDAVRRLREAAKEAVAADIRTGRDRACTQH